MRVTVVALPAPAVFLTRRASTCRPARLRLRPRLPLGVRRRAGADDAADRHRCRRHQHRCGAAGRRQGRARGQDADHRRCHRRHRRRADGAARRSRGRARADRRRRDRHDAFRQRGGPAPRSDAVAAIRIGLPASASLPPFCDWPRISPRWCGARSSCSKAGTIMTAADHAVRRSRHARGGAADPRPRDPLGRDRRRSSRRSTRRCEIAARAILRGDCPDAAVTLSHELGRIGLLERENAALLNAALSDLARVTMPAFREAIADSGIDAPLTSPRTTARSCRPRRRWPCRS